MKNQGHRLVFTLTTAVTSVVMMSSVLNSENLPGATDTIVSQRKEFRPPFFSSLSVFFFPPAKRIGKQKDIGN